MANELKLNMKLMKKTVKSHRALSFDSMIKQKLT